MGRRRYPFWLWPNLLSLDAPLLALLWQEFLAVLLAIPLRPAGRAVLGLTVWSIYLADRLLDAQRAHEGPQPARHRFYKEHYRMACVLLAAVLGADAAVTLLWLRPAVVLYGAVPFAGVIAYIVLVHSGGLAIAKEPLVAILFTAGTFVVAWTNAAESRWELVGPAATFFLLCLANVVSIEKWEWEELRGGLQAPHPVTLRLARSLPWGVGALAAGSAVVGRAEWYEAIAVSAAVMAGLLLSGRRLSLDARRVLVDAALLSPLLFLWR